MWVDEKGRPTIIFPRGEGKHDVEEGVWYRFELQYSREFYMLTVNGKPISHGVCYAYKCVPAPRPTDEGE